MHDKSIKVFGVYLLWTRGLKAAVFYIHSILCFTNETIDIFDILINTIHRQLVDTTRFLKTNKPYSVSNKSNKYVLRNFVHSFMK